MAYVVFLLGETRGKPVGVTMGVASHPEEFRATLASTLPFEVRILGAEMGARARLEELQVRFAPLHLRGTWYRPQADLLDYVASLPAVEGEGGTKRVSLDLEPEDFADLEVFVREVGLKTKASLLRRAFYFYRALYRYKAEGWLIQAVKGGKLVQFPDLDKIAKP